MRQKKVQVALNSGEYDLNGAFGQSQEETKGLLDSENLGERLIGANRKISKIYLFWAGLGSCLIGVAGMLRGIEASTPLPSKFSLSLSYLVLSILTLIFYRCRMGEKFKAPWMLRIPSTDINEEDRWCFSFSQLCAIVLGGVSEFIVSISVIMSFNAAQKANINQGIGSSVMTCNSVLVTILSYFCLNEVVSRA